jgi:short-subunit dehydrogenase
VKLIEPGPIKTDFYDRSMNVLSARVSKEYKDYFEKGFKNLQNFAVKAPKADKVAQVIYRAASDGTNRLRYPADKAARLLILASKLLPKRLFFAFVRKVVE